MNGRIVIDQAGRVVIPKRTREALGIAPGDALTITLDGDGITLRPERHTVSLQKERGVWVFRTGVALSRYEANEAQEHMRAKLSFKEAVNGVLRVGLGQKAERRRKFARSTYSLREPVVNLDKAIALAAALEDDGTVGKVAIEHGATLCSTENGFSRLPGLKWKNPLSA